MGFETRLRGVQLTGVLSQVRVLLALVEALGLVGLLALFVVALVASLVDGGGSDRRVSRHDGSVCGGKGCGKKKFGIKF